MDTLGVTSYSDSISKAYASSSSSSSSSTSKSSGSTLDMTDFLKLMAAQFKNQSMDSSTDNAEYITELAQFSAIQAMTTMTQTANKQYAASLVGSTVTVSSTDSTTKKTTQKQGVVKSASFDSSGNSTIDIDGTDYDLSDVVKVLGYVQSSSSASASNSESSSSGNSTKT
jgi:flagellar basal-body rod modification protein FlgD